MAAELVKDITDNDVKTNLLNNHFSESVLNARFQIDFSFRRVYDDTSYYVYFIQEVDADKHWRYIRTIQITKEQYEALKVTWAKDRLGYVAKRAKALKTIVNILYPDLLPELITRQTTTETIARLELLARQLASVVKQNDETIAFLTDKDRNLGNMVLPSVEALKELNVKLQAEIEATCQSISELR